MGIYIDRNGQRLGPYPLDQVNQCLEQGSLLPTDSAWHDGMTDWVPLNQINGVIIPGESPGSTSASQRGDTLCAPPSFTEGSICPTCQAPVDAGQAFCMGCGANLQSGQAPTLQTTTQSAGKKKLLIGVGAGVGVLALAAVGFFVIYPKLSGDGTNQQLSETVAGPSNQQKAKMDPPLPDDIPSLEAFLKPGAHQLSAGHKTKAQYKLGKLLKEKASKAKSFTKERRKLYYEAKKHLTPAAENGHALAQWELGWVLHDLPEYGREEAIKWFKMSA